MQDDIFYNKEVLIAEMADNKLRYTTTKKTLKKIKQRQNVLIIAAKTYGMSLREISSQLGISKTTVRDRVDVIRGLKPKQHGQTTRVWQGKKVPFGDVVKQAKTANRKGVY